MQNNRFFIFRDCDYDAAHKELKSSVLHLHRYVPAERHGFLMTDHLSALIMHGAGFLHVICGLISHNAVSWRVLTSTHNQTESLTPPFLFVHNVLCWAEGTSILRTHQLSEAERRGAG